MRPAMTEDELMHFGIKGMRWGVRRFQNPDGTRTAAGLKRYRDKPAFMSKRKYRKIQKQKAAQQEHRKSISEMTDEELDYAIRRKQKEKQLEELLRDPQVQAKGQSKVKSVLKEAGLRLVKDAAYKVGMDKVEKVLKSRDPDVQLERAAKKLKYQQDTHNLAKSKHEFEKSKAGEGFQSKKDQLAYDQDRLRYNQDRLQYFKDLDAYTKKTNPQDIQVHYWQDYDKKKKKR